ncbi:ubiquinone/menaquinone biosynthesis C-methylase UbiE [Pantoea dispersa]|uniref:class I SAM-dependent methyltransferase n=1 Tax=Pantoea dispersa TaxID=59814 RepID=UPI003D218D97
MGPVILDMCCGSRMFWMNKQDPRAIYLDARSESHVLCDNRKLEISPDVLGDFRQLPFADGQFHQVIFDPPHLRRAGQNSWMRKKYGQLDKENWREDLRAGFTEAFRVLVPGGTLIFKWNATQIPVRQILELTDHQPTIWHRAGKADKTHWIIFMKEASHD